MNTQQFVGIIAAGLEYGKSTQINIKFTNPFLQQVIPESIILQESTAGLPLTSKVISCTLEAITIEVYNLPLLVKGTWGGKIAKEIVVYIIVNGE